MELYGRGMRYIGLWLHRQYLLVRSIYCWLRSLLAFADNNKNIESFIFHATSAHLHPVSYRPQGCRSSYQATCRAASFRRLSTTSAVNLRASLCARTVTAGVSAAWTSPSVTVLTLTWTLWKTTCCASEMPGG